MTDQPQTLAGKVAIITGASYGLGRDTAKVFAARGAQVLVTGRTAANLESLRDEIRATGGQVEIAPGDVGVREDVERAVQLAVDTYGGVDILVNNAQSLSADEALLTLTDEQVLYPMRNGLFGTLYFMQACHPHMKARGGGAVINYGSGAAQMPVAHSSALSMCSPVLTASTMPATAGWRSRGSSAARWLEGVSTKPGRMATTQGPSARSSRSSLTARTHCSIEALAAL